MKLQPTIFCNFYLVILYIETISLRNNYTRFVENSISFVFIEEVVKNVAWVPGEVWINCPLPSSQFFRQLIKFWMASCCFGTIKDLRRGFLLSKSPICTICPEGGGVPQRVDPLSSWLWKKGTWSEKVASNLLKIREQEAYRLTLIATRGFRARQNSYGNTSRVKLENIFDQNLNP